MKAYILAAGMGTRLGKYTENLPKGMLNFMGKSLIERQVETLRSCGVHDITILRGYNPEKINIKGVKYAENKDYANTNMVATLMAAHDDLKSAKEDVLVCYSDIVYEPWLIKKLQSATADVNVLVDDDWQGYWKARLEDWQSDVESLQYDAESKIFEIGTPRCDLKQAMSRYIGLIKFSVKGIAALVKAFDENKKKYWEIDAPWRKSKSFKKAYMTCMLQELVDRKLDVRAVHVRHGWMEFDTTEDYEKALSWAEDGTLSRFISLDKAKLVAITQRVIPVEKGADRDGLDEDYVQYYQRFGIKLIPVPNVLSDVEAYLSMFELSGIILSGGNDVNPKCYGEKPEPSVKYADDRDATEKAILDYAIKREIPVFAECRGSQFLNAYFGGKLKKVANHVGRHDIKLNDKEATSAVPAGKLEVNSYHNIGFTEKELSKKLKVFAKAPDGVVEGVYHEKLPIAGIMWHPERESAEAQGVELNARLVSSFLKRKWFWK